VLLSFLPLLYCLEIRCTPSRALPSRAAGNLSLDVRPCPLRCGRLCRTNKTEHIKKLSTLPTRDRSQVRSLPPSPHPRFRRGYSFVARIFLPQKYGHR
jgi:hypothetical protein